MDNKLINITLILADHATAENGKLFILGGGWDRLNGGGPYSFTVAALAEIAVDSAPVDISGELTVMDPNGQIITGPDKKPIRIPLNIQATKPDDPTYTGWIQMPLVFRLDGLALNPGRYSIGLALGEFASSKNFIVVN